MARYTGAKCKLCRREGTKLFLKGSRCYSEKCAMNSRPFPPGQHGNSRRRRLSDYGRHLREKQKVKRMYGLLETQFKRYYYKAEKTQGVTGQLLLQMLERRLDNIVYASGLGLSRAHSRQMIGQGKVTINGKVVTIPSYQVKKDDLILSTMTTSTPKGEEDMPAWLKWNKSKGSIEVARLPVREDTSQEINEQLIVEYYSR